MDPFTIISGITSVIGLGAKLFGGIGQVDTSQQQAQLNQQISGNEIQINDQRRKAMEIDARRRSLEMIRQQQLANSMGLNNATNQGAQFGSGLQGGYAQNSGQTNSNLLGLQQNLDIGRNIFGYNNTITGLKGQVAGLQGQQATYQGISALGGGLMQSANPMANLAKSFFGSQPTSGGYNFNLTGGLY